MPPLGVDRGRLLMGDLTRHDVADDLNVSVRTVGRMLENGLRHYKLGDSPQAGVRIRARISTPGSRSASYNAPPPPDTRLSVA
jgi:hypothetical protein